MMTGWLLVSYGPRPRKGDIGNLKAAQTQLRLLRDLHGRFGRGAPLRIAWDYARTVERLSDLPVLSRLLESARLADATIVVASLQRIMSVCPAVKHAALMAELDAYGEHLRVAELDARRFDEISAATKHTLAGAGLNLLRMKTQPSPAAPSPTTARLSKQTAPGRATSAVERSARADEAAERIADVREQLLRDHGTVTNNMIADAANAAGLRTSRGGLWRRDTVHRALQRLDAQGSASWGAQED